MCVVENAEEMESAESLDIEVGEDGVYGKCGVEATYHADYLDDDGIADGTDVAEA